MNPVSLALGMRMGFPGEMVININISTSANMTCAVEWGSKTTTSFIHSWARAKWLQTNLLMNDSSLMNPVSLVLWIRMGFPGEMVVNINISTSANMTCESSEDVKPLLHSFILRNYWKFFYRNLAQICISQLRLFCPEFYDHDLKVKGHREIKGKINLYCYVSVNLEVIEKM